MAYESCYECEIEYLNYLISIEQNIDNLKILAKNRDNAIEKDKFIKSYKTNYGQNHEKGQRDGRR